MAKFAVDANKGAANVTGVLLAVAAAASGRRAKIYDWTLGCGAAPADNAFTHVATRCTAAGTGAAKTPVALDAADTLASTIVCKDTITIDPATSGTPVLRIPLNQRASFRWVAAPYGELIVPVTASNGFLFGLSAASTTSFDASIHYDEQ